MSTVQLDDEVSTPVWKDVTFLLTAVPLLVGVLNMLGYLPHGDSEAATSVLSETIKNGFLFAVSAVNAWKYFTKDESVTLQKMAMRQELRVERLRMGLREKSE